MTVTKKILLIAGICVALVVAAWVCLAVAFIVDMERGEEHQRQIREEQRRTMSLMNWYLGYYQNQARSRLELLLERGADVNSAMPKSEWEDSGYTLLLYRTKMGLRSYRCVRGCAASARTRRRPESCR